VARASRKAQELAASQGIDLASLRVAGIITERHVQEAIAARQATMQASPAPAGAMVAVAALAPGTAPADHPAPAVFLETPAAPARTSPVSRVQAAIARQVLHATQSRASAFVILRCEVDATLHALERMLEQKKRFLAFPEVLVYHVARCLRQLPRLNAVLIGDTIHEYQQVNLAFTVDIAGRLYTPVIHDADRLSLLETSTAMQGRKLQILRGAPPEASLRGGTFTVSVLDTAGLLYQLPIINRGQSAILGAGARVRELIPDENGAPRVVTTVGLCLTYDHRLLNGSQAAAFLAAVAERLGRDPEAEG
jgi:2-oxoglutarate dehydrogenase E2 component (dihydrolipoamide succinyltransferase)